MSKIICHDYYENVVTSLTQWDTNRVLKIHNWQYDVSPIIQWTNRSETESYEVESILNQDGTVTFEVPNALLQNTETAIVFIGVARNGENGSSDIENATVFKVEFPIQRRTKPSGYVYSDNATVVDIVALKEVLENQIEAKIDSTRTDLSAEITSALHATLDSVKDGAPKATFETQEDLVGKKPGIYLYHHTLGSTDPMAKYDGYVFYWDGEKLSDPLTLYGGKDSQANIAVTLIKPSTGEQFLKITVTDKDGNENIITTDNLNGKDSEGIKKIIYNGSELAVSDDKTVEFNAQPYIKELDFINDESEIEKLTIGKLYIVTKEMNIDRLTYYPGSLIMKTTHGIAGFGDFGFILNGDFAPVWNEIQDGITFKKTPSGYEVSINNKKTELILPTKTSDLQNDSNFVSDENYVHTDNNYTKEEKTKLGSLANYDDTTIKEQIAKKQDKLSKAQLDNIIAVPNKIDQSQVGNGLKFANGVLSVDIDDKLKKSNSQFELIQTVVFEEDKSSTVLWRKPVNADYVGLSEIMIICELYGNSGGIEEFSYFMGNDGKSSNELTLFRLPRSFAEDGKYYRSISKGLFTQHGFIPEFNKFGNNKAYPGVMNQDNTIYSSVFSQNSDYITTLKLNTDSKAKSIGAGTKIYIWGVKKYE